VSAAATIVDMIDDGTMRTLREGTNGFTFMPRPIAICLDKAAICERQGYWRHRKEVEDECALGGCATLPDWRFLELS